MIFIYTPLWLIFFKGRGGGFCQLFLPQFLFFFADEAYSLRFNISFFLFSFFFSFSPSCEVSDEMLTMCLKRTRARGSLRKEKRARARERERRAKDFYDERATKVASFSFSL